MTDQKKKRVAILISGRGSNMRRLIEASQGDGASYEIAGVLADHADAAGLNHAHAMGVETAAIERGAHPDKTGHEAAIDAQLRAWEADIICLAGFMRLLSPAFVERWSGRMINIHPSLLPLFRGLDTHRRALDSGLRIHGCSVHFVSAETDGGAIIAQAAVPVRTGDNTDSLMRRVLAAEHKLYPAALDLVARGRVRLKDGRAEFDDIEDDGEQSVLLAPAPVAESPSTDIESLARFTP